MTSKTAASIRQSLAEIALHLTRLRRPVAKLLQPGVCPEQIAHLTAKLSFSLSPELVALYGATNGTRTKGRHTLSELWFFPGYYLLSLEAAVAHYRDLRRHAGRRWKASWFPIFADDAGDYFAVPCGKKAARGVVAYDNEEPEQRVEYVSLDAMLKTLAECFTKGAFFVKRREFEVDDDKHAEIARRHNPRLAAWNEEDEEGEEEDERTARGRDLANEANDLLVDERRPREALDKYERAMALRDHDQSFYVNALFALNSANAKRRLDPRRMRRMVDTILARKRLHADTFWNAACTFVALRETDKCIDCLRQAKRRGVDMKKCLADTEFASLANDPRFLALRRAVE